MRSIRDRLPPEQYAQLVRLGAVKPWPHHSGDDPIHIDLARVGELLPRGGLGQAFPTRADYAAADIAYYDAVLRPITMGALGLLDADRRALAQSAPLRADPDTFFEHVGPDARGARDVLVEALKDGSAAAAMDAYQTIFAEGSSDYDPNAASETSYYQNAKMFAAGGQAPRQKTYLESFAGSRAGEFVIRTGAFTSGATGINKAAVDDAINKYDDPRLDAAGARKAGEEAGDLVKGIVKVLVAVGVVVGGVLVYTKVRRVTGALTG